MYFGSSLTDDFAEWNLMWVAGIPPDDGKRNGLYLVRHLLCSCLQFALFGVMYLLKVLGPGAVDAWSLGLGVEPCLIFGLI